MMYQLIEKKRGREEVVMTGDLKKVNKRLTTLRTSRRGDNVVYSIQPADDGTKVKFRKQHRHREH